jgi:hypothetical protein
MPGSPGSDPTPEFHTDDGGGAIRLQARQVQLDGKLLAVGSANRYLAGSGSGGGIWLTCDRLVAGPAGRINANGGTPYDYSTCGGGGGGGGGRVAVAVRLSPQQVADLYASGSARGLRVQEMADTIYAATVSVAPGIANQFPEINNGTPGTAVFIMGSNDGTIIMVR